MNDGRLVASEFESGLAQLADVTSNLTSLAVPGAPITSTYHIIPLIHTDAYMLLLAHAYRRCGDY